MAERDGDLHRYDEEETRLILRRATEVELRGSTLPSGGHTLEELASIAREAGIDPDAVRRAARLVPARAAPVGRIFPGAPSHAHVRARFPGTLPDARIPEARDVIERSLERTGELDHDVTGFLWHEDHGVGRTFVRVRREEDATSVEVESDRRGHLLALIVVLATLAALLLQPLGGFAGLAAVVGPLLSVAAPLTTILVATRLLWPRLAHPALRRAETAVLDLGALVRPPARDEGGGSDALPAGDQPPPSSGSGGTESGAAGSTNR